MDVLLGAGAALLGVLITGAVAIAAPLLTARRARAQARRDAVSQALMELHIAVNEMSLAHAMSAPGNVALTLKLLNAQGKKLDLSAASGLSMMVPLARLGLLLNKQERVIVDMGHDVVEAVRQGIAWDGKQLHMTPAVGEVWGAFVELTSAWHRGDLPASDLRGRFDQKTKNARAQLAAFSA